MEEGELAAQSVEERELAAQSVEERELAAQSVEERELVAKYADNASKITVREKEEGHHEHQSRTGEEE